MTLTGTFGVFVSAARPVWLTVLPGRGTVWDITGALALFIKTVCGGGTLAEMRPFLSFVSLHILVFPSRSAAALEPHLLVCPEDVREAALHGWAFFGPSPTPSLCFMDLSLG